MFEAKRTVHFSDCDPAGVMFFAKTMEFCHSAYEDFINSFNLNFDYWGSDSFAVPIKQAEVSFLKTIKHGEEVTINLKVLEIRDSSFLIEYFIKNNNGEICLQAKTVHVFVSKKNWKKIEIDSAVKESLSKFLEQ
jgi:YbgC/YbaW family acyl-CoA thioester hydrolase